MRALLKRIRMANISGSIFGEHLFGQMLRFFVPSGQLQEPYINNWNLFLLIFSSFWLIRSLGETLYWFLTQFTTLNKDPAEKFFLNKFFPGGAVFFINQMLWQCVSIMSLVSTIYFSYHWLILK